MIELNVIRTRIEDRVLAAGLVELDARPQARTALRQNAIRRSPVGVHLTEDENLQLGGVESHASWRNLTVMP